MRTSAGYHPNFSYAVTTAGEVLLVESTFFDNRRSFTVYKKDPNPDTDQYRPHDLLEVHSLGDEALLLDLGITVPANPTLDIKPNCIYFTRHDPNCLWISFDLDICVFNLTTKSLERFPRLDKLNLKLKDARWFLPIT
ncbi:F-box protein [Cardamine amara subsp. amara]|uniref:F-box protein n=1 Tax=Cardamine amara subsp. amara TaxID=228776 RepID=A0ABD1B9E2_CARAN